ncbi:hypothetical protein GCM10009554_62010 [Kribbella koreensis]|uniref:Uncharacterized protein n=1 Tax=Kribbella koreensis TaxID=57909 RepID=A0ABP4BUK4_9ACTN
MDISDSVLITGVGGAVGTHLAGRFATAGRDVVGVSRQPQPESRDFRQLTLDLARPDEVEAVVDKTQGVPAVIIHAAVDGARDEHDLDSIERSFRVNAIAPYVFTRALLERAAADDAECRAVFIGSEAMFHADDASGPYAASKAASRVLTASLAAWCRGRRQSVAYLSLGPLLTPARSTELSALARRLDKSVPEIEALALARSNQDLVIDRFISLDAVADSIDLLLRLGRHGNGTVVRVDGGSAGSLI